MKLIAPILMLLSLVNAANDDDFKKLQSELDALYKSNSKMIPLIVRLSYHDLLNQPKAAGKGCIQKSSFFGLSGNQGLAKAVNALDKIIQKDQFKNAKFDFGDVIAFAGKVAIETAYPCSNIKFKYNRGKCGNQEPVVTSLSAAPSPNIFLLHQMTPHHQYIGFSLNEFAILTIGAHAINGAAAHREVLGFDGVFSRVSSGANFIKTTLAKTWIRRIVNGVLVFVSDNILRIPSDLLFSPDALVQNSVQKRMLFARKGGKKGWNRDDGSLGSGQSTQPSLNNEDRANQKKLQTELQNLADFDAQFVRIYEKMLNAGGGSTPYNKVHGCVAPTPPVTTSTRPSVTSAPTVTLAPTVTSARPSVSSASSAASSTSSYDDEALSNANSLIPSSFVGFLALLLF